MSTGDQKEMSISELIKIILQMKIYKIGSEILSIDSMAVYKGVMECCLNYEILLFKK